MADEYRTMSRAEARANFTPGRGGWRPVSLTEGGSVRYRHPRFAGHVSLSPDGVSRVHHVAPGPTYGRLSATRPTGAAAGYAAASGAGELRSTSIIDAGITGRPGPRRPHQGHSVSAATVLDMGVASGDIARAGSLRVEHSHTLPHSRAGIDGPEGSAVAPRGQNTEQMAAEHAWRERRLDFAGRGMEIRMEDRAVPVVGYAPGGEAVTARILTRRRMSIRNPRRAGSRADLVEWLAMSGGPVRSRDWRIMRHRVRNRLDQFSFEDLHRDVHRRRMVNRAERASRARRRERHRRARMEE